MLLYLLACTHRAPEPAAAGDPVQLATFEAVYQRISETYPYPDMRGVDWQGAHDRLLPQAQAARTADELRPALEALLATLGESHFGILPGDRYERLYSEDALADATGGSGDAGLELRWVEGSLLVFRLTPGGGSALAGLRLGDAVTHIGTTAVVDVAAGAVTMRPETAVAVWSGRRLTGPVGSTVSLTVRSEDGSPREVAVQRQPTPGEVTQLGFLPPISTDFAADTLPNGAGYIRFNAFMTSIAEPFGAALARFAAAPGVVVDVRGNMGGVAGLANGLAGFFITESGREMGRLITREGELHLFIFPRPPAQRYSGQLAILVDEASFSTAEIFAAGLQALGRARVFGARSPGMALPSRIEALPNGDALQYAFADFYDPLGRRVEGAGAVPDAPVPLTAASLAAGHDPVIDAAACWIQHKPGACP